MKRFLVALCLIASTAFAGERLLGVISQINATKGSASTSPDGGQAWWDGGYDMPFCIPPMALITIQCDQETSICTDLASCTLQKGVEVAADSLFLTSTGSGVTVPTCHDGGCPVVCGQVAMLTTVTDSTTKYCSVFERTGKE